jgi:rhodanese-related sulfurtransferase
MAVPPSVTNLSPDEVAARREAEPGLLILDVRNEDEWAVHHIEDATLIPMRTLRMRLAELDPHRETVVVCEHGSRSNSVAQFLAAQAGFTRVCNMVGGMSQWTGPVVTGE